MSDDVLAIVLDYLTTNRAKFDGLVCVGQCACLIDDLAPCDEIQLDCTAGYKEPCDNDCHEDHGDWHITEGPRPKERGPVYPQSPDEQVYCPHMRPVGAMCPWCSGINDSGSGQP
jgi:hypothetical protein